MNFLEAKRWLVRVPRSVIPAPLLVIPAQAGAADCGPDRQLDRWRTIGASHPPPNLPPKRGEGLNWGRGGWGRVGWEVRGFLPAQE